MILLCECMSLFSELILCFLLCLSLLGEFLLGELVVVSSFCEFVVQACVERLFGEFVL